MGQDAGGGVEVDDGLDHLARVDAGPVDGPPEQLLEGNDAVAVSSHSAQKTSHSRCPSFTFRKSRAASGLMSGAPRAMRRSISRMAASMISSPVAIR